jgi:hypothetical protein
VPGGADAYLKVEKPCFLFLGGSTGIVAAADVATAAPPDTSTARAGTSAVRAGASAARAGTSAARAASLLDCLATGAPAPVPGAVSSATSAALGEGAQAPTSLGELVPHCSPPPRPTTSTPKSPGKRVPAARAAETPHSFVLGAPVAGSSSPSCAPPAPIPAAAPRARSGSGCGRVGPRGVHGHQLQGMSKRSDLAGTLQVNGGREDKSSTH